MDPVSLTASVIAIATLATQSCKLTYNLIASLVGAPDVISNSQATLLETGKSLESLKDFLDRKGSEYETSAALQVTELVRAIQSTNETCDEFRATIDKITKHSSGSQSCKRDRIAVNINESKIDKVRPAAWRLSKNDKSGSGFDHSVC
ncbi:uncharacterized protein N7479_000451 [Penicillium vulpinum]|uniref:uncharacterized protein n=1 Tax=Penicillium vulpinum TaxID=29845 RepID=UPI002548F081|nr:uncharacterized protein N7479_000451 [Penicillium vulpinum]KAJ5970533.1 hypothetical protein N7479_000451 [Penicillium vulpinum]